MAGTGHPSVSPGFVPQRRAFIAPQPYRLGMLWTIIAVISLTIVGPYLSYKPAPFTGEGSPLRQIVYILTFGLAIYTTRAWRAPMRLLVLPASLVLVLAWCWLSLSWALNPDIALRRLVLTSMLIWTIFILVNNAGYATTMTAIRTVLSVLVLINYVAVIAFPESGIHQFGDIDNDNDLAGSWRGIMLQKNFAGAICALTIMIFLLDGRRLKPLLRWSVILATAFFLIRTNSKTSMGIGALGIFTAWLYNRYNPAYRALLIPAVMILGVGLFILSQIYWKELAEPFNSPAGFTGRVQIWPALIAYAHDHPLLGAGYGSFWNIGLGFGPIFTYAKGWVTGLGNGHNGYLDLLVQIGFPGLGLVILATIIMPLIRLLSSYSAPRPAGGLLVSMIVFCAGHNMTETSLFDRDAIVQVFLMFAIAMIAPVTAPPRRPIPTGVEPHRG
jgi:O-antigen ligase